MKTKKNDRPKIADGDKRPAFMPGTFWLAPGEDIETAQRLAGMTPNERAAWKAAKTDGERVEIERTTAKAARADHEAAAAARKASIRATLAKADAERREREGRKRQEQDDLHTLAESARTKTAAHKSRARVNRRNGKLGGRKSYDKPEKIICAVEDVRRMVKKNASLGMKRACEFACKDNGLTIKWPALRRYVVNPRRRVMK